MKKIRTYEIGISIPSQSVVEKHSVDVKDADGTVTTVEYEEVVVATRTEYATEDSLLLALNNFILNRRVQIDYVVLTS